MHDGDLTRSTFDAARHFSGVRLQQGRVQLDADWNEQLDIAWHHDRAAAVDTIGTSGAPRADSGLTVSLAPSGDDLLLSPGRCWVDGVLCETAADSTSAQVSGAELTLGSTVLDGQVLRPHEWVRLTDSTGATAQARLGTVDTDSLTATLDPSPPALSAPVVLRRLSSYAVQPDLPAPELTTQANAGVPRTLDLPDGQYLAYLDVWQRSLTALDVPQIRETALGGPDTATRTRTVWQVRLLPLTGAPAGLDCSADLSQWTVPVFAAPTGRLAARAVTPQDETNICTPTPAGGFVGLENQLYRVQVHDLAGDGSPILLWSRENASVVTVWSASNVGAGELTVSGIGPDDVRGFAGDQWVELTDDAHILRSQPGTLVRLLKAEGDTLTVDPLSADGSIDRTAFGQGALVRRWDSDGAVAAVLDTWVELELGVQVRLGAGTYHRGDYWLVPARTAVANVDWPLDPAGNALFRPPDGVERSAAHLAIVRVQAGAIVVVPCLREFPSLTTLTAVDVAYDDSICDLTGVDTVQQALDRLCRLHDLRRHHQRLHGWGIVDGLQVRCGPNQTPERRIVTVRPGGAITPNGDDLDLGDSVPVDILDRVATLEQADGPILDENGDGDVCLAMSMTTLDAAGQPTMDVTKYEAEDMSDVLQGTLLMDFYDDCIKSLRDWLAEEFTPPADEQGLPVGPQRQLVAALGNLLAQPVNPGSGQSIFISAREDDLLQRFYAGLRQRLQSETFCAMFDGARTPPAYPQLAGGLDTVFGTGGHARVRMRPGGGEAWTVGSGVNPLKPTALINRYNLSRGVLVSRIDAVAGVEVTSDNKVDTGTGAVTDVAFSPDGATVYVAIPTRNEDNTIFRVGRVTDDDVRWQPTVTICGLKLVTLATTAADPSFVYAIAHHKQTTTAENGQTTTTWHGTGLFRIDPSNVDPNPQPMPIQGFFPAGHLVITPDGRAVATAMDGDIAVGDYSTVVQVSVPAGQESGGRLQLPSTGSDDLTTVTINLGAFRRSVTLACVVVGSRTKSVLTYNLATGGVVGDGEPVSVHEGAGAVSLLGAGDKIAVAVADEYLLKVLDPTTGALVADHVVPLQVGPLSLATAARSKTMVALNYVSNTLSVVPLNALQPTTTIDLSALAAYRAGMLEAFADLLGGFLQYLKDGFFDHFLVNRPEPTGREVLYLAAISIRGKQVYRVCNFSRRRYVKSFPLVGYWLSAIPILPLLGHEFARVACTVLVQSFGRYDAEQDAQADSRVSVDLLTRLLQFTQSRDLPGRAGELRGRGSMFSTAVRSAVPARPVPSPPGGQIIGATAVGQPTDTLAASLADQGVTVVREQVSHGGGLFSRVGQLPQMLRDAAPGDTVTLYESEGKVQYFAVRRAQASQPGTPTPLVVAPDLDQRLAALEAQVTELRRLRPASPDQLDPQPPTG